MRVRIITYGCAYNKSDSRIIKDLLRKKGYEIVKEKQELTIVNTCTVKKPTENKVLRKLEELRGKKVLITGCLVEVKREFLKKHFPNMRLAGLDEITNIPKILKGGKGKRKKVNRASLSQKPEGIVKIVPLCDGCLGNCSYCITKLARGKLKSFPIKDVLKQVDSKEVWLTAQDTACYGLDIKTDLAKLLREVGKIRGVKVRVGMMNPKHALKILRGLVSSFDSDSVFKFLHLPVQSGSDEVLKHMKRGYAVKDFERIVKKFRDKHPRITLSTDVIAGYPTETENDFEKTVELLKRVRPDVVNISMYWEMQGTEAAELKQHPNRVRKERSRKLTKLCSQISLENNKKWIGWEGVVLVDEVGKKGMVGRNDSYKPVVLENGELGERVRVRIVDARTHYLLGKVIS